MPLVVLVVLQRGLWRINRSGIIKISCTINMSNGWFWNHIIKVRDTKADNMELLTS